jgi:hypothetical protein
MAVLAKGSSVARALELRVVEASLPRRSRHLFIASSIYVIGENVRDVLIPSTKWRRNAQ